MAKAVGIVAATGAIYRAKSIVLTAGTSSRGKIIIGELMYSSGPNNSLPSIKLSENLEQLGFKLRRFKTGTPPRVNGNTIDFSKTEEQPGDKTPNHFSFTTPDSVYLKDQLELLDDVHQRDDSSDYSRVIWIARRCFPA